MENNKIISLFRTLSKEEFRQMARFVRSPVYNRHEGVIRLFDYLRRQIEGGKEVIKKEKVLTVLFPGQTADIQELHYLNSYLLRVCEQFLAWSEWQKEENDWGVYLLRAYQKRGLEKPFQQNLKKTTRQHEQQLLRNATYYRQQFLVQWEAHNYSIEHGRQKGFNLQEMSQIHEEAFIAEKLKNACILLSHQAVSKTDYDTGLLEAVLQYVRERGFEERPAIAINYYSYLALTNTEEDQAFSSLKAQLINNNHCFTLEELRDAHIVAINCCIRRINLGKLRYLRELFDLYQSGLSLDVFLTKGQLSPWTYSNITLSGLRLKEFDWAKEFIETYRPYLPENQRDGFYNYNLARYYYELGDYQRAMPLLMQMENDDLLHNLSAKMMLAKMYFELRELNALDNLLSSFKTYIYRKEVSYHRDAYLSFIGLMNKLIALKPYDKKAREKLRAEIDQARAPEKEWLLKQLG